ncbi:MAG: tetratricopeptide repeat protein, partial [Bacteroidia bacterium]
MKIAVVSLFLWFAGPLWAQSSISAQMKEGQRHFDAGHFKEASLCFSKAIEKLPASKPGLQNPELAMAYYARALCLLKLKDNGSAVVDFNKCIFLDTTLQEAYYNRAVAYHATQNYHFALADLSRFLSYQPADTSARQLRMRMAQQMSEFELAASDAWYLYRLQGQERFFKEWTNHCLMGELWGRYVLGSDTALLEHPQWTWIHMDRAWALHVQGSYEQSQGD